jgi:fermentation-respiration switch protein FrsA (DUF1100 family)
MKKNKTRKIILWVVVTLLVLFGVYTIGGSMYLINFALLPKEKAAKSYRTAYQRTFKKYTYMKGWVDSLNSCKALRDTTITNKEGLKLHGYYIKAANPTRKTAIVVHGYTDCAISMFPIAYMFNRNLKFNVLLPDLQFHGKSEGKAINMGWKDRLDVLQWTSVADSLFGGNTEMVIQGISMGGATTMMVSGEKLPPYIKCFIDDCGYTSAWDEFSYELKEMFGLPEFPILYTASLLTKVRFGWSFGEASALKQVAKCKLPMLFIHGNIDTYVPTRMVFPLYQAKPQPKEIWMVPGATHAQSYHNNQRAYTARVAQFVNKYIH